MSAVLPPSSVSRLSSPVHFLGWCVAVLLIAAALLPQVPKLAAPRTALRLEIAGDFERVNPEAVRLAVSPRLNADFYELDLGAVKAAVEALPWVARARVERAWPAAVRVHVWEHKAYARWGDAALLSQTGEIFTPDGEMPEGLPRLAGPAGRQQLVRETFESLRAQLDGTPLVPVQLALNERGEWTAVTADDIELRLGRGAPADAAARLAGPVRTALEGRLQEVAYVDLHYVNGFAVGWREPGAGRDDHAVVRAEGRDD